MSETTATAPTMTITSIAPWYGGKRTLAPVIVQELGRHHGYFEPFCGGMSVLMAKAPCSHETVNDLHSDLINLARCLAEPRSGAQLYRRARRLLCHEDLYREALTRLKAAPDFAGEAPDVERAVDYLLVAWMGRNGQAGLPITEKGQNVCVRWTPRGGSPSVRWQSVVDSLRGWSKRLRRVMILRRDAFEVLSRIADDKAVAIYVDPPYIDKSDRYVHDFDGLAEADVSGGLFGSQAARRTHEQLAALLGRFTRARVVLSYYPHPALDRLYPRDRWTRRTVEMSKALSNTSTAAKATEVLLINGPSYAVEGQA